MGYGDPYHKHPLRALVEPPKNANCFHCEFPITDYFSSFGCDLCDYYIHDWCQHLPIALTHPLHDQHPLTRFEPLSSSCSSSYLCNECQSPCLGRFAYQCATCQFFFHLKCLSTLKHEKLDHPLILSKKFVGNCICGICGFYIAGFSFGCGGCKFFIHHECSLIPVTIKRHHVHELTLSHNFPEECDQVYCDICEDKDGELDRKLSYYYCKRCDYIAHVHCCITQPRNDAVVYKHFTHKHPLTLSVSYTKKDVSKFCCSQCDYSLPYYNTYNEYPSLLKHPRHPEHNLVADGRGVFNCTKCQFTMDNFEAVKLTHPLLRFDLKFTCTNSLFRCDACGELGEGSRVGGIGDLDFHLECFSLPGKLEHESHSHHPLYLCWLQNVSIYRYCSICTKEMDPQLWFYFCQECDYAAHISCVASDSLSTLRSLIRNQPDFCAIILPDETSFEYQIAEGVANCDLGTETVDDGLRCPKCNLVISTEAQYSTIEYWESGQSKNFCKNDVMSADDPLSLLDEQIIDELCCPICNVLIFPPTYSCTSCQILFHKSCAELPGKTLFAETAYDLIAPPFPEGLSNCFYCKLPISSFAYISSVAGRSFDVQCASRSPVLNQKYHNHTLYFQCSYGGFQCSACKNCIERGTLMIYCKYPDINCRSLYLHPECGLLPSVIMHYRAHQHPLELATNLAELDDEYICDVCEKDLNPNLWAYRCVDSCGIWATSHVSCVITSKKKCHFRYEDECQNMTEDQKLAFRDTKAGIRKYRKGVGS